MEAHRRTGNFSARGGRGGGGCGKQFAQKVLACCPNFYETVEKKRRSDITMYQHRPTCVVKIFLHINLSYELIKHVNSSLCRLTAEDMNDTIHVIVDYRVPIYLSLLISARLLTRRCPMVAVEVGFLSAQRTEWSFCRTQCNVAGIIPKICTTLENAGNISNRSFSCLVFHCDRCFPKHRVFIDHFR